MTLVVKEPVVEIKDNFPEVIPEGYVKVEFKPGDHGTLEGTTKFLVKDGSAKTVLNAPTIKPNANYEAKKDANWEPAIPDTFTGTEENNKSFVFTAQYTYIGKDVVEQKPGDKKPDVPSNFVKVEFKKGDHGVISSEETTIYWVNPEKNKTLGDIKKPEVIASEGYKFTGWDKDDTTAIGTGGLTVIAQYKEKVVTEDPNDATNYAKLTFSAGDHGTFDENAKTTIWVLKNEDVKFNAPAVKANDGFVFSGWEPALLTKYTKDETHTAKYEPKSNISDTKVDGFQEVRFMAGSDGNFGKNGETPITEKSVWVRPGVEVDLSAKAPKVIANEGKVHTGWEPSLKGIFTKSDKATEITAQYSDDKDGNGVADDKEKFDIKKATKVEILQNPYKMKYSVTEKTGKTPFDATGVIIRLTDASGKTATYTYADITSEENKGKFELSPADKEEIGLKEDGLVNTIPFKVTVTGADKKPTVTAKENITVILDKDGNGVDDRTETTPEPDVMARNIGTDGEDGKKVPAKKTTVEIKTEPKAKVTIEYTDKDGQAKKIENLTAGEDGKLTQEITPKLKEGTEVKVTVQDGEKKPTDKTVKVFEDLDDNKIPDNQAGKTERPAALASNIGKKPAFTTITGEAEKGATVTAKVGTEVVGTATADSTTGKYTIEAKQNNAPIKEGVKIDVTAILAPKTESLKQTVVVFNDTDGTGQPDSAKDFDVKKATGMQVVASPDKMVYSDGDKLNLDGLKVLVTDVNENQKIFTYNSKDNKEFTDAGLSVDYKQGDKLTNADNGKKLTVTLDTKDNKEVTDAIEKETPTALTVNKNQSAQPTDVVAANQGDAKVTKVKGKAVKDAEIKITDANGKNLLPEGTTIKANDQGEFTADLNELLKPGTKVIVTATEPGKSESPKAETTVIRDKDGNWEADTGSKLSTPVIDPIREKDEKVVVEAPNAKEKIKTIEVSDQNGNTVTLTKDDKGNAWTVEGSDPAVKVTQNSEGKLEIPVKDKLPLNDRDQIKVTFKDGEKPANEAFDKEPVQKASQTPTVDPVYTGDKSVKIVDPTVADPTAKTIKVKVGENDTRTIQKQDDGTWKDVNNPNAKVEVKDGKVIVPLDPSAKKDDVIKVSTINDSGKASPAAEVTVVDKVETQKPTIDRANKDENSVSGTAAPNAEVTVTVTPKGGEPKTFTGKADGDGNYKVTTDPLVDGDTVVVKASEPGKADNTSDPKVVGVDTSKLKESIDKAEEIGGENGKDLKPDTNKVDKELKDALNEAKKVKEKGDNGDKDTNQAAVDKAKENLDKAIAQKEADKAVDKAKDNPTPENIKDAQDKIDAIPGSKDPKADDYNPIKKELQDKLDLIEKIKEGEDRLKKDDIKDKPIDDVQNLKDKIKEGKEALDNKSGNYGEKTKEIEKAITIINQEKLIVNIKNLKSKNMSLDIVTSAPRTQVSININGVDHGTITTSGFGTYTEGLQVPLKKGDKIILEATKDGYNSNTYKRTLNR